MKNNSFQKKSEEKEKGRGREGEMNKRFSLVFSDMPCTSILLGE